MKKVVFIIIPADNQLKMIVSLDKHLNIVSKNL